MTPPPYSAAAIDFATTNVPFAVSCALDCAIVLAAIVLARGVTARALFAVLAVLAVKGLAMIALGLNDMGVAHVVWLDLVIVVPLAGLALFAVTRRPVALLALLLAPVGAYASFVEPERLVLERATVDVPGRPPGRVGGLSHPPLLRVGGH